MVVMENEEITHPAPPLELQKPPEPEPRQPVMINVDDVDFCYGAHQVLFDVNLEIQLREVTAFIGPSGCGKSTLLRCLNRMNDLIEGARVTAGRIKKIDGVNINDSRVDVIEKLRKRVGMVFQKSNPFPKSIYENITYGLRIQGEKKNKPRLDEIVERSLRGAALWEEVKDRLDTSAYGLSGGQQQRLCIARALAVEPEVILMDEPCSALDPIATAKVEELIYQLRENFVDIMRDAANAHAALSRGLNLTRKSAQATESAETLARFDQFSAAFSDSADDLNGLVSDAGEKAVALRDALALQAGDVDRGGEKEGHASAARLMKQQPSRPCARTPQPSLQSPRPWPKKSAGCSRRHRHSKTRKRSGYSIVGRKESENYLAILPATTKKLQSWDPAAPVPAYRAVTSFLFGRDWITASFWQDWYGIIPLLVGLDHGFDRGACHRGALRRRLGYLRKRNRVPGRETVNQTVRRIHCCNSIGRARVFRHRRRRRNHSATFAIALFPLGRFLSDFGTPECFSLLARSSRLWRYRQFSPWLRTPCAMSRADSRRPPTRSAPIASRQSDACSCQPPFSGIVSAILLGLGRVIGETMVVLLCAGNRIAIPDFTQGLGAFFQPVHTMTGIIAQEMGEVVRGSIHYRALFMVGLVLFAITLAINYGAQKLVQRYRMSIG